MILSLLKHLQNKKLNIFSNIYINLIFRLALNKIFFYSTFILIWRRYLTTLLYCQSIYPILLVDFLLDQEDDIWLHNCIVKVFNPSFWWISSLIWRRYLTTLLYFQSIYPQSCWWISSLIRKTIFDSTIVFSKYLTHLIGGFLPWSGRRYLTTLLYFQSIYSILLFCFGFLPRLGRRYLTPLLYF